MASDSKKSNQAAGEGKKYCHRAHWLSTLGLLQSLEIPEDWKDGKSFSYLDFAAGQAKGNASLLQATLSERSCNCIDCQRPIPKIGDRNKHGERK